MHGLHSALAQSPCLLAETFPFMLSEFQKQRNFNNVLKFWKRARTNAFYIQRTYLNTFDRRHTFSFSSSISYENEHVKEFHKSMEENEKKAKQDLMNMNYYPFLQELNFS